MPISNHAQLSFVPNAGDLFDAEGMPNTRAIRKIVFSKMSAEDFARQLGISASTLRSWEYGERQPSGAALSLLRIAAVAPQLVRDILGDFDGSGATSVPKLRNGMRHMTA